MKTVKEFKDAGLEFVKGDFREPISDLVQEFAWRTNTGEKPRFKGEIEIKLRCEISGKDMASRLYWGVKGFSSDILEWRPVISEEDKMEDELAATELAERVELVNDELNPIYTQEMHDAGELPPIGSKFMLARQTNCQRLDQFQGVECDVIGHCKNLDGDDMITFSNPILGYACMVHCPEYIKPIDTRTEREKSIDEMFAACYPRKKPSELLSIALGRLYDAGYRKTWVEKP